MKILIVYTHPSGKSFNRSMLEAFLEGAKKAGHKTDVIDLYADKFDPVLKARGELSPLARKYQDRMKKADHLVFIFPIWWYRAPAMLEGFFDQVFSYGFAFKYKGKMPVGLLPFKKVTVIESYGGPWWYYLFLRHLPWKRIKTVFKFCGIKYFNHLPCYGAENAKKQYYEKCFEKARKIAGNLE